MSTLDIERIKPQVLGLLSEGADIPAELQEVMISYVKAKYPAFAAMATGTLTKYHATPKPMRAGVAAGIRAYITNAR